MRRSVDVHGEPRRRSTVLLSHVRRTVAGEVEALVSFERHILRELASAAREMRRHQIAWFGGDKSRETLSAALAAEKRLDRVLADAERVLRAGGDT